MEAQYEADLRSAVDTLPVSAVSFAAGLVVTLPAGAASAAEREYILELLRARGPTTPTLAQAALLSAWAIARELGSSVRASQGSSAWQTICNLGLRADALAAFDFYERLVRANTARACGQISQ